MKDSGVSKIGGHGRSTETAAIAALQTPEDPRQARYAEEVLLPMCRWVSAVFSLVCTAGPAGGLGSQRTNFY